MPRPSLTAEESRFVCEAIDKVANEDTTDVMIDLMAKRVETLLDDHIPWWGKIARKIPFLPDPIDVAKDMLDDALPGLIRDPLMDVAGCSGDSAPDDA